MRLSHYLVFVFASLLLPGISLAKGPEKIATLDRSLWPFSLSSSQQYNLASQYEIKRFAQIIATTPLEHAQDIKAFTLIDNINAPSVTQWLSQTKHLLLSNYNYAAKDCSTCGTADNWQQLSRIKNEESAEKAALLEKWYQASGAFYQRYLYEQVRLAALFPRISSEIQTFNHHEITGHQFKDNEFLLTFDDGPSNNKGTEHLIELLNKADIHSFFFVMGERIAKSTKNLKEIYRQQCLGSHGFKHKSHQKWAEWQDSLATTSSLLSKISEPPFWFRPPYGQRTPQVTEYLAKNNSQVMLWNIDSQDWNRKLSNQQALDRVMTLMLLWRKGIILYHDIHSKALFALPELNQLKQTTGVVWKDCRSMAL